jgi:hypothetical protein
MVFEQALAQAVRGTRIKLLVLSGHVLAGQCTHTRIGSTRKKGVRKMKLVGSMVILLMLTSAALAKKAERREKKSDPVRTINTLRSEGKEHLVYVQPYQL